MRHPTRIAASLDRAGNPWERRRWQSVPYRRLRVAAPGSAFAASGGWVADACWATDGWAARREVRWPAWLRAAFFVAAGGLSWAPVAAFVAAVLL